jgi:tetratricopeptide (TPR) repeat protein
MKKENLMSAILGLIVGLVVGFVFANSVNRTPEKTSTSAVTAGPTGSNPALPPDHPPLGTSQGGQTAGAPLPQVSEAIEKARNEPQNYEAQMTAADLYYQIQRFGEAAKLYEAANKLKPTEAEPLIKAGNSYFDLAVEAGERNDEQAVNEGFALAEKWYLLALKKEPKNIIVQTDLGLSFFLRTPPDIERAIQEYKAALRIDPNHEITLQNLARAYVENGDKAALRSTLDKLKKVNPKNPAIARVEEVLKG